LEHDQVDGLVGVLALRRPASEVSKPFAQQRPDQFTDRRIDRSAVDGVDDIAFDLGRDQR
jgi:hypothetical protein